MLRKARPWRGRREGPASDRFAPGRSEQPVRMRLPCIRPVLSGKPWPPAEPAAWANRKRALRFLLHAACHPPPQPDHPFRPEIAI